MIKLDLILKKFFQIVLRFKIWRYVLKNILKKKKIFLFILINLKVFLNACWKIFFFKYFLFPFFQISLKIFFKIF